MSTVLLVLCVISLFIEQCQSQGTATLTSNPSSLIGSLCPQAVTMKCSVRSIQHLRWFTSGFNTIAYTYSPGDESQVSIDIEASPPLPTGVRITVVNVTQSTVDPDRFTAVSTLSTTLSVFRYLNISNVYCGSRSNEVQSEIIPVDFNIIVSSSKQVDLLQLIHSMALLNIAIIVFTLFSKDAWFMVLQVAVIVLWVAAMMWERSNESKLVMATVMAYMWVWKQVRFQVRQQDNLDDIYYLLVKGVVMVMSLYVVQFVAMEVQDSGNLVVAMIVLVVCTGMLMLRFLMRQQDNALLMSLEKAVGRVMMMMYVMQVVAMGLQAMYTLLVVLLVVAMIVVYMWMWKQVRFQMRQQISLVMSDVKVLVGVFAMVMYVVLLIEREFQVELLHSAFILMGSVIVWKVVKQVLVELGLQNYWPTTYDNANLYQKLGISTFLHKRLMNTPRQNVSSVLEVVIITVILTLLWKLEIMDIQPDKLPDGICQHYLEFNLQEKFFVYFCTYISCSFCVLLFILKFYSVELSSSSTQLESLFVSKEVYQSCSSTDENLQMYNDEWPPAVQKLTVHSNNAMNGGLGTNWKYPQILFFNVSATAQITSSGISINRLEDMGISMVVPEGSISSIDEHIDLHIQPCFSGPFQLPPEYEPASPTYLIHPSRKANFLKDVIVRIQHYVHLETEQDCADMAFFSASYKPEYTEENKPVYTFNKILCGANTSFRKGEQVGEIALRHFCLFQNGKRKRSNISEPSQSRKKYKGDQCRYSANLYTQYDTDLRAIFCMCRYTPLHMKLCDDIIGEQYTGTRVGEKTMVSGTITGDEVEVVPKKAQEVVFDRIPAKILKQDIDIPNSYMKDVSQLKHMYPPRLKMYVKESNLQSVEIIGLDRKHTLNIVPIPSTAPPEEKQQVPSMLAGVDNSGLGVDDDLVDVEKTVEPLASKWRRLSTKLYLKDSTLDVIEHNNPGDVVDCLHKALVEWLKLNYDHQRHGRPSWRMLAEAVISMDNKLFEKISKEHPAKH